MPVLTVAMEIAHGTSGEDAVASGAIVTFEIPEEFRPRGALSSPDQLDGGKAVGDLPQNQVVTAEMFGLPEPGASSTTATASCDDAGTSFTTSSADDARCPVDEVDQRATRVPVVKVVKPIESGATGEEAITSGAVVIDELPLEFRPSGALTELDQLRGGSAVADLVQSQVVTASMFGVPVPPAPSTTAPSCDD